jgi:branched-chain amino acid transport system permease protein
VFNFAHAAVAFFVAECYYVLHTRHDWPVAVTAPLCILVIGPVLALLLWVLVFRVVAGSATVVRVVAAIGLYVAIPSAALMLFGTEQPLQTAGLFSTQPPQVRVLGVIITANQLAAMGIAALVALGFAYFLRRTTLGFRMRAVVDNPDLARVYGVSPTVVSVVAWSLGGGMAALAGILLLPTLGLNEPAFTTLLVASFAAVVIARLRSMLLTFLGAVAVGVVQNLLLAVLPSSGVLATGVQPSVPFFILIAAVAGYAALELRRGGTVGGEEAALIVLGALRASAGRRGRRMAGGTVVALAVVLLVPHLLSAYWLSVVALGVAYGVLFLSFTAVTGEGGMISLCQVSFAGIGAVMAAQLATTYHWPAVVAVLVGGLVALPAGALVAAVSLRLGELHLALVTLGFAVLADNLIFTIPTFYNGGAGVALPRPSFLMSDQRYYYGAAVVFAIFALLLGNVRRSLSGMVLSALRTAEQASATIGIRWVWPRLAMFSLGAAVAGVGGALVGSYTQITNPETYNTLVGLVWLAVVVTWGIRSVAGALLAGVSFSLVPALVSAYLPTSLSNLPGLLFGTGAVILARHPGGVVQAASARAAALSRTLRRTPGEEDKHAAVSASGPVAGLPAGDAGSAPSLGPTSEVAQ